MAAEPHEGLRCWNLQMSGEGHACQGQRRDYY